MPDEVVKEDEINKEIQLKKRDFTKAGWFFGILLIITFLIFLTKIKYVPYFGKRRIGFNNWLTMEYIDGANWAVALLIIICILFLLLIFFSIKYIIYNKKGEKILLEKKVKKMNKQIREKNKLDMLKSQKAELEKKIAEYEK